MREVVIIHITDAKVTNQKVLDNHFSTLKNGAYALTTKRYSKRSDNQNRYYWGCVVAMIRDRMIELGNDVDSTLVHDFLKDRFNSKDLFNKDGVIMGCIGDTTTKLTKLEFEEYLEKVKRFAAETLDLVIPDPGQPSVLFATYDPSTNSTIISNEM